MMLAIKDSKNLPARPLYFQVMPHRGWAFIQRKESRRSLLFGGGSLLWLILLIALMPSNEELDNEFTLADAMRLGCLMLSYLPIFVVGYLTKQHPAEKYSHLCFGCGAARGEFNDRCHVCGSDFEPQRLYLRPLRSQNPIDGQCSGFDRISMSRLARGFLYPGLVFLALWAMIEWTPPELLFAKPRLLLIIIISAMFLAIGLCVKIIAADANRDMQRFTDRCLKCESILPDDKSAESCPACGATLLLQRFRKAACGLE